MKPFIKWAGGKRQSLSEINKLIPKYNTYIEPFLGGGSVFFSIYHPKNSHYLFDINNDLIRTYRCIRDNVEDLTFELTKLSDSYYSSVDSKEYYYLIRERYNNKPLDSVMKSAYFIFLNKTCFNGLYRVNKKGSFNVPFGYYKKPLIYNSNLISISSVLKNAFIDILDFRDLHNYIRKNTFIYFDPPYMPVNKTSFTSYTNTSFSEKDQTDLANIIKSVSSKAKIMMSNSSSPLVYELYKDFNICEIYSRRSINSDSSGRSKIKELLITNY
jgi:DNA adenine methylase